MVSRVCDLWMQVDTVDDINPALPIIMGIYHTSHSLGSLRQC